jgi:phenylacetate-CoA ligase
MMVAAPYLSDEERFPLLSESGRLRLKGLREHPHAPRYNMACGDRLDRQAVDRVALFERQLFAAPLGRHGVEPPAWAVDFAARSLREVPIYRRRGGTPSNFESIPPVDRSDIAREPWSFVPDHEDLSKLIVYYTSGTHGRPMDVLAHPEFAAKRLPLFRAALAKHGVTLDGGNRVSIVFVCSQLSTITYASVSTYLGEAGHVKINLNPDDWRDLDDRAKFIEACDPEIFSGDPLSLLDLAALQVNVRPKALVSSAMAMMPGARAFLEERFGCPVVDLYSTCESGPIAVAVGERFLVLPHDLYVEVIDRDGRRCREGERGEIALTGGRNPYLPLLRYRTGDWAAMTFEGGVAGLRDFEGRDPVVFRAVDGRAINNIDVTTVMRPFALSQFAVKQRGDGSLLLRLRDLTPSGSIVTALRQLFGAAQKIDVEPIGAEEWKVETYAVE